MRLLYRLKQHRERLHAWAKNTHLRGFQGSNLHEVGVIFFRDIAKYDFNIRALAMAYSFFFAIFPSIIFLFTLLPYIPIDNLTSEVELILKNTLPMEAYNLLLPTIESTLKKKGFGVISIAFALVLFAGTRGVLTMLNAFFRADVPNFRQRGTLEQNGMSIFIFFCLFVFLLLGIGTTITVEYLLNALGQHVRQVDGIEFYLLKGSDLIINLLMLYGLTAFIYYAGPPTRVNWAFLSPGAVLAGTLLFIAELLLRWYFLNFNNYNKVYGTLGAVMILMAWFYYISIVLLLGFELNTAIDRTSSKRKTDTSSELTPS